MTPWRTPENGIGCVVKRLNAATRPPHGTRMYHEFDYAAASWPQPFRVILKAEVMSRGDNPRFVVTTLDSPTPEILYKNLYCARGQDENYIKRIKNDLAGDRTSDHRFLANHMRLFFACGAYVLHHAFAPKPSSLRNWPMRNPLP